MWVTKFSISYSPAKDYYVLSYFAKGNGTLCTESESTRIVRPFSFENTKLIFVAFSTSTSPDMSLTVP